MRQRYMNNEFTYSIMCKHITKREHETKRQRERWWNSNKVYKQTNQQYERELNRRYS